MLKLISLLRIVRLSFLKLISSTRIGLRIYFLVDPSFDREMEAATLGRIKALERDYENMNSSAHFRRCIHRLEKGIYRPDRRQNFGEGVIVELLDELKGMRRQNGEYDDSELVWGREVQAKYRVLVEND